MDLGEGGESAAANGGAAAGAAEAAAAAAGGHEGHEEDEDLADRLTHIYERMQACSVFSGSLFFFGIWFILFCIWRKAG